MSPRELLTNDLRRIGYPVSRELTLRRCVQAGTPPASAHELAAMAKDACLEGAERVNGGEGKEPDPVGGVEMTIVAHELLDMAQMAERGIGRG
jgi:hypothetical protein